MSALPAEPDYIGEMLALPLAVVDPEPFRAERDVPPDWRLGWPDWRSMTPDQQASADRYWIRVPPERRGDFIAAAEGHRASLSATVRALGFDSPAEYLELVAPLAPDAPERVPVGTGVRPMTDVDFAPPPDPIVGEYLALHPGEAAVLYGPGGSTKGTTSAWVGLRHVRADPAAVVYVLDFEHHEAEWGGRLRRLGASGDELGRIHYASPYSAEWTAPRGFLADVAEHVRADCDRLGVSLLIVDSITTAASAGEAMGGQAAASEYFDALSRIGRRSLSLAHVKGDAQRWPDRPFGSVHIHNLARETWAIAVVRDGGEDPEAHGLTSVEVELRCKKANGRRKPRAQVIAYTYEPDYGAITVAESERQANHGDLAYEALRRTPDLWLSGRKLAAAILEDTGERLTEGQVYDAIRYDKKRRFQTDKSERPFRFRVAE